MTEKKRKPQKNLPGLFVRQQAAKLLEFVLAGNSFEPLSANQIEDGRDRALINRLVSTALRRHGHLNIVMSKLLQRGLPKRSGPFEFILRIGLVQLLYMEEVAAHSAIHLAVEAAKNDKRAARFDRVLNGVLRQAQREELKWRELENVLLFPTWLQENWSLLYGQDNLEEFGETLVRGASLDITLKDEGPKLIEELGGEKLIFHSIRVETRDRPVREMAGFEAGSWWVQDVAATLSAGLFSLPKKAKILDICAAPGGKTAQLVKAGYEVTALDNSPGRLKRLEQNLLRLNYSAEIVEADAQKYTPSEKFDGVLVDAPCTATGTFRRHPEVLWHRTKKDVANRVVLQREIIDAAINCLKSRGELILCVCSLQKEEGEEQADWVTQNYPQLHALPIKDTEIDGLAGAINGQGWIRCHPGLQIGQGVDRSMDGFFIARWRLN